MAEQRGSTNRDAKSQGTCRRPSPSLDSSHAVAGTTVALLRALSDLTLFPLLVRLLSASSLFLSFSSFFFFRSTSLTTVSLLAPPRLWPSLAFFCSPRALPVRMHASVPLLRSSARRVLHRQALLSVRPLSPSHFFFFPARHSAGRATRTVSQSHAPAPPR